MSNPSNLYAEKIFSEHPSALWPLDDKADYISLINEQARDLTSGWSITGGNAQVYNDIQDKPFPNSTTIKLTGDLPTGAKGFVQCISDDLISISSLNSNLGNFSVGSYFYSESTLITSIEIGYEYYDVTSGENIRETKLFNTSLNNRWIFVSHTFDMPLQNSTIRLIFKVNYSAGGDSSNAYKFYLNGLSVGQWSEEFNATSLGLNTINLPSSINLEQQSCIPTEAYGFQNKTGYYFIDNNSLVAKNSGIPMVYGASNITVLYPNSGKPSLIVPGNGFLNESGKHKTQTLEMWIRLGCDTPDYKRIIGPINSEDGLYVNGPFLTLHIGAYSKSYFVGEWLRPMLLDLVYSSTGSSVILNGEEVININYSENEISFISEKTNNKSNDWIGFYAYDDVTPIDIDCIAIYPYKVPTIMAKRRFVYGQGVSFPENINQSYSGTSVVIDYPYSKYTNNYSYPDIADWTQGNVVNLMVKNGSLTMPEYTLPEIILSKGSKQQWLTSNSSLQDEANKFITFGLSNQDYDWSNLQAYLLFQNASVLMDETKCIYGVFKIKNISNDKQTLFRLKNNITGNFLSVDVVADQIIYSISNNLVEQILHTEDIASISNSFIAGLDLEKFKTFYSGSLSGFLGNLANLSLFVGGNDKLQNTFTGNIYRIGFANARNFNNLFFYFNQNGLPFPQTETTQLDVADYFVNHSASYTLIAKNVLGDFILDIAIQGYWEDYIPLTYFAKYIQQSNGNSYYDLDMLQFNINYPAPSKFAETVSTPTTWSYEQLQLMYSSPTQKPYSFLDNELYTGYNSYQELKDKTTKTYNYDTTGSFLKSYITFQYISEGSNNEDLFYTQIEKAGKNGIIAPGSNWLKTKYEVVDNMIIYPPADTDFNLLSLVVHMYVNVDGIFSSPLAVKQLQIASQAFNENSFNPIGTKLGIDMYPYKKTGVYYDYKSHNPFSIYKGSTPYLHLTKNSGIRIRGDFLPYEDRGISIPINTNKANNYEIMAMQMCIKYDEDFFTYTPIKAFEIINGTRTLEFYLVANQKNGKRARIYAIDKDTGQVQNGIGFYLNGNMVNDPVITVKEWAFVGISFSSLINFDNYTGRLNLTGPLSFNNISYYQSTKLTQINKQTKRPWYRVKSGVDITYDWLFWDKFYSWDGVLVIASQSVYGADLAGIYRSYMGTEKIIVDDDTSLVMNGYNYPISTDITWRSPVQTS